MKERENKCNEAFREFKEKHPALFQQPIIQSFLREGKHEELIRQAICSPTQENMRFLDETFRMHYGKAKALTYLSKIIYYNAINFDKAVRKHHHREMLTLDQPLKKESEETQKDMLYDASLDMNNEIARETIADYVEDPELFQAIQKLTEKQQKVITYKYVHSLKNKEIAHLFSDSPQNISKMHQKVLQKLKKHLQKGEINYDDGRGND